VLIIKILLVTILTDPEDYHEFLKELEAGDISEKSRQLYSLKAFSHTAEYDEAISDFFRKKFAGDGVSQLSLRYVPNMALNPSCGQWS
jgi:phosphoribosylaminoimidazolecarboxamide formyltransferase/IMP cyclohydrolase